MIKKSVVYERRKKHEKKQFQGCHRQSLSNLMPVLSIVEGGTFGSPDGRLLLRSEHPACSEHGRLDLPGFKNLEGLPIGLFPA